MDNITMTNSDEPHFVDEVVKLLTEKPDTLESDVNSSSTSISNNLLTDRIGLEGKERKYKGSSLSISIKECYGISHNDSKTINELSKLSRFAYIVNEMNDQRCFILSYLTALLDRHHNDKTVKLIIQILVKRKLLFIHKYTGLAKSTFGLPVYYTHDASEWDLEDTLREYIEYDELRYAKQLQRQKKKVSPKEVVEYGEQVKQERIKMDKENRAKGKCCEFEIRGSSHGVFQYHTCGRGVVKV